MKAIVTVKRITEYATIIDIEQKTFDSLQNSLDQGGQESKDAEKWLDSKIDTKDWQDDQFRELVSFEEFKD